MRPATRIPDRHRRPTIFVAVAVALLAMLAPLRVGAQQVDHFTCYRTTSAGFAPVGGVSLVDHYGASTVEVRKPKFLCAPTDKNGEDPSAPSHPDHLEDYQIKRSTPFVAVRNQAVVDQFGTQTLDVRKPLTLQVPTAKSRTASPPAPVTPAVDHFQCYAVRRSRGSAKFTPRTVTLEDQFGAMTVEVKKPRRLCAPVDKRDESPGAENHPAHLLCYRIKQVSAPRFAPVSPLYTNNQFGPATLDARKPAELCVPALRPPVGPTATATPIATPTSTTTPTPVATITPPPLCGNGTIDAGEQCDGAADGACPGSCTALCQCAVCGDGQINQPNEECDGTSAPTCPGMCQPNCACPGVCDPLDPSVCLYPFPNDFFTVVDPTTDTGRRVNFSITAMPRNKANVPIDPTDHNRSDGFSPGQSIELRVPGYDALQTGAVPITDIERSFDPAQPIVVINASTLQRHLIWSEIDSNASTEANRALYIRPAVNFDEDTRYIVALRNMRDAAGALIAPSADFLAYRDGTPTGDPAKEARRAHMEDIFTALAAAGIARNDLYLAWDFTVASRDSLTKRALGMRDDALGPNGLGDPNLADLQIAGSAPSFTITSSTDLPPCGNDGCAGGAPPENPPGGQEFCDALKTVTELMPFLAGVDCNLLPGSTPSESDRIARRVEGTFTVPCYLFPDCEPGGTFVLDGTGRPTRNPASYTANFVCNIPRSAFNTRDATTGTAVPARPSLYGHGLLGTASEVNAGNVQAMGDEHDMIFCATDWAGFSTSDAGIVVATLQDASNFPKMVDRMQQGFLDFMYLGRLLLHADGFVGNAAFKDGAGNSLIDATRLFYDGNSQGGIMGGSLTALAPDFDRSVLGVPGMNYSTLLQRSTDFTAYAEGKLLGAVDSSLEDVDTPFGLYDNYPNELERPLLFALMQMLWDRGEANGYAHHITSDPLPNTPVHTVLLHEAFGDHQVANVTTEVEARTLGLSIYQPALAPGRHSDVNPYFGIPAIASFPFDGSALVVWDSGTPTPPTTNTPNFGGSDPHGKPRSQVTARTQKSNFLQAPGGAVIDVCGGAPCLAP
jgi:hypothetical protein